MCLSVILCLRVCEFSSNGKLAILSQLAPVGLGLASANLPCHTSRSSNINCISLSQYNLYISFVVSCISLSQSVADNDDYDVDNQEGALDVIESLDF